MNIRIQDYASDFIKKKSIDSSVTLFIKSGSGG
ncbi:MAG: hypothetical protein K0Q99_913 [Clostridia bacterium]|jgi:hypothetical protein|nr:hypothetical protein [Clostridia bacterium]